MCEGLQFHWITQDLLLWGSGLERLLCALLAASIHNIILVTWNAQYTSLISSITVLLSRIIIIYKGLHYDSIIILEFCIFISQKIIIGNVIYGQSINEDCYESNVNFSLSFYSQTKIFLNITVCMFVYIQLAG